MDELYPVSELHRMLAASDYVVVAVPLTGETKGIIGEAELRAMRPDACLINIARGGIVDEAALVRVLKEGRLAGAGLDVFATAPLPADSELWTLPHVILSAHNSGVSDRFGRRVVALFCENLRRYVAGEELINKLDPDKGY